MNRVLLIIVLIFGYINASWTDSIINESKSVYNGVKDTYSKHTSEEKITTEELKKERFDKIWTQVHEKLSEGSNLFEKKNASPDSTWFSTDKDDVQDDIDEILSEIIEVLVGDDLLEYKVEIADFNEKIDNCKISISGYRNKKIAAPKESLLHTTKDQYTNKIKETKSEIEMFKNEIIMVQNELKVSFNNIGVNLTTEQIDVLLTRIDGDDIIQISLVMDVLKQITNQIMVLMQDSSEELSEAKRYYGMHLVSLELIVYIQQNYINKVNNVFVPKIDTIINTSKKLIIDTKQIIKTEKDKRRHSIYETNIKAQRLTLEVADLYKSDLIDSKKNMKEAQNISKKNLKLAHNTYSTVMLSSDLYSLISDSQTMFNVITKIQIPNIVPFENTQIQEKYKELTKAIALEN